MSAAEKDPPNPLGAFGADAKKDLDPLTPADDKRGKKPFGDPPPGQPPQGQLQPNEIADLPGELEKLTIEQKQPARQRFFVKYATGIDSKPLIVELVDAEDGKVYVKVVDGEHKETVFNYHSTAKHCKLVTDLAEIEDRWAVPAVEGARPELDKSYKAAVEAELRDLQPWGPALVHGATDRICLAIYEGMRQDLKSFTALTQMVKVNRGRGISFVNETADMFRGFSRGIPSEENEIFCYRLLHPKDNISQGIHAVDPSGKADVQLSHVILNAHWFGFSGTPYITMCKNPVYPHIISMQGDVLGNRTSVFGCPTPEPFIRTKLVRIRLSKVVGLAADCSDPVSAARVYSIFCALLSFVAHV